jgi:signal transduction histidine kinase
MLDENEVSFQVADVHDCIVWANRAHLGIVLSNLFLNSFHALQGRTGGSISLGWKRVGDWVEITFADNGCGISPDHMSRIFDAFFSTKSTKGTGLGLATCKRIVEMYGGTISANSTLGIGTRFTILLPTGAALNKPSSPLPSRQGNRHDEH